MKPNSKVKLGTAIQWMMEHDGQQMIDSDGDHWYYDGEQYFLLSTQTEPGFIVANILLPMMLKHRFTIARV